MRVTHMEISGKRGGGATVACRLDFDTFDAASEFNDMLIEFILKNCHVPRCAECRIPITSATAEGREDELICDKCLNELADSTPIKTLKE